MVTSISGGALKPVCAKKAMTSAGVPRKRSFVWGTSADRVQMRALLSWPIKCQDSYRWKSAYYTGWKTLLEQNQVKPHGWGMEEQSDLAWVVASIRWRMLVTHWGTLWTKFKNEKGQCTHELIGECQCGLMATLVQSTEVDTGWLRAPDKGCWPQWREFDRLSPNTWKGQRT